MTNRLRTFRLFSFVTCWLPAGCCANRSRIITVFLCLACWLNSGCGGGAGGREGVREVHVAAAANLRGVLDEIARDFEAARGIHVVPTVGATSQLAQQIENGAPVDVFLAADTEHVDGLISKGMADSRSRAIYARGRLVLWAPSRPDITSLRDLAGPKVGQVGCARPELAPYGAAAVQALRKAGLWTAVEPKLVYGQNISVAKQFADSGNTAASFTALSLVVNSGGHYVLIDESLHDPLDQALCVVKASEVGRQFRDFVLSTQGGKILARYGYAKP
jgi:molybdate transport system substrate-binding protein